MLPVIAIIAKQLLARFIIKRLEKRMLKKLISGLGLTGLIVGVVSQVSGVDIAPQDVDVLVSAASILAVLGPKVYDGVKAKFFTKKE